MRIFGPHSGSIQSYLFGSWYMQFYKKDLPAGMSVSQIVHLAELNGICPLVWFAIVSVRGISWNRDAMEKLLRDIKGYSRTADIEYLIDYDLVGPVVQSLESFVNARGADTRIPEKSNLAPLPPPDEPKKLKIYDGVTTFDEVARYAKLIDNKATWFVLGLIPGGAAIKPIFEAVTWGLQWLAEVF